MAAALLSFSTSYLAPLANLLTHMPGHSTWRGQLGY